MFGLDTHPQPITEGMYFCPRTRVCVCVSVTNVNHHLNTPLWQSWSKKCMNWSCGAERVLHELHKTASVRRMRRAGRRGETNGSGSGNTQPGRPNNNQLLPIHTHTRAGTVVFQQCSSVSESKLSAAAICVSVCVLECVLDIFYSRWGAFDACCCSQSYHHSCEESVCCGMIG